MNECLMTPQLKNKLAIWCQTNGKLNANIYIYIYIYIYISKLKNLSGPNF